jgi:phytanoyl-CoA hydroxylase
LLPKKFNIMSYLNQFKNDGYCIIPQAIPLEIVYQFECALDAFRRKNEYLLLKHDLLLEGMLHRVVNLHYSVKPLLEVFIAAMNAGSDVVDYYGRATLYTSLFFELGSQQSLHRDTPYFYSGTVGGYMGVWAALDDVDENNGALIVIKGSHKLPEPSLRALKESFFPETDVPPSSTPLFNAYNEELISMAARGGGLQKIICKVKKGDLIIWHPATLHGGLPHLDKNKTRKSLAMHITPKNMPMKHMDYFFHRNKIIEPINQNYDSFKGRLFRSDSIIDFRHMKSFDIKDLGEFF